MANELTTIEHNGHEITFFVDANGNKTQAVYLVNPTKPDEAVNKDTENILTDILNTLSDMKCKQETMNGSIFSGVWSGMEPSVLWG